MKKFILLFALCGAVSLTACNEETSLSKIDYLPEGDLMLTIVDVADNTFVSGVKVSLLRTGVGSVATPEPVVAAEEPATRATLTGTGMVTWENLRGGNYQILLEKEGYASMILDVDHDLVAVEERPVVAYTTVDAHMHKLVGKYEGTALYEDLTIDGPVDKGVRGAAVELTILPVDANAQFVHHTFAAQTDSKGAFVFEGLPEYDTDNSPVVVFSSIEISNGLYMAGAPAKLNETHNYTKVEVEYVKTTVDPVFDMVAHTDRIAAEAGIVFKFNYTIDVDRIEPKDITVRSGANEIAFTSAWSDSNKTLTLTPISGKWAAGETVDVEFTKPLYRKDTNQTYTVFVPFTITIIGVPVANIANLDADVAAGNGSVELTWEASTDATGYEIYRKKASEDNYTHYADVVGGMTETYVDNNPELDKDDNRSNSYMVVPVRGAHRLPFEQALTEVARGTFV